MTRAAAEGLIEEDGRVVGARVRDGVGGEVIEVARPNRRRRDGSLGGGSRGAAVGRLDRRSCRAAAPISSFAASGSRARVGLTIRVPGKVVFLVPWPGHWLIGTTDAPVPRPDRPPHGRRGRGRRAARRRSTGCSTSISARDDVVGTYAGLRPLIAPSGGSTVKASREHRVVVEANGLVRVGGGKYTTYRIMARDAIDAAVRGLGLEPQGPAQPDGTLALVGAADREALDRWRRASRPTTDWRRPSRPAGRSARNAGGDGGGHRCRPRACWRRSGPASTISRPRSRGRPARRWR